MRDPPARHDGRWLMTPLDPRRGEIRTTTIMTTPRTNGSPRLFLPPSWYRVVSHGVSGLQDEILSTDHDVSRHNLAYIYISLSYSLSLSLSLYHSVSALRSLHRFRLVLSFSSLLSYLSLSSSCSRAQSSISNDYARRSPQVDPTATHERSRSVQSRGSVHEGVRTALFLLCIQLFTSSTFSESKAIGL